MAETVETDTIEQQQAKATELLEITADGFAKCQGCDSLKPLIPEDWRLRAPGSIVDKIRHLRNAIAYAEKYRVTGNGKKEREQLAELLQQEEKSKKDVMRRLPLYNTALTNYRWLCSECYDKADRASRRSRKS